ncbi:hypothetical protein [Rhodococcus sp. JVH1]|uniref:hypothetical protein n=1 Tax=Rhodococcus sp. JVH1 TaxID=745408 RepID=UPI00027211F4|nr:hypothetical protein [Rhodococcus sp. JVH1]EJJ02135.1 hypothetical protein JVH1_0348 [Rhodococcus sp. JVH1]
MRHEARENGRVSGPNGEPDNIFPALDGVRHRYLRLPGLRMHVAEAGHGEPVVLRLLGRGRQRLTYHLLRDFTTNRNTYSENDIELFAASCAHRPAPPPRPLSTAADAHRRRRPHRAPGVPRRMRGAHR